MDEKGPVEQLKDNTFSNNTVSSDLDAAWELVKCNISKLTEKMGEDEYRIWHSRMLSNFYKAESIKDMNVEQLAAFAEQQQERLKQVKE